MEKQEYPYVNNMEINYNPLELIGIQPIVNQCTDKWYNETLCKVNESVVRLSRSNFLKQLGTKMGGGPHPKI